MHDNAGSRTATERSPRPAAVSGRAPRARSSRPPGGVVLILIVSLVVLAAAPTAWAGISDDIIAPSWTHTEIGFGASSDHADAVALAAGGVTYVAGWVGNVSGNDDITLTKYVDGVTDPTWGGKKTWDGVNHSLDQAHGVATGPGGVVYTVGTTVNPGGRAVVIKWSAATGDILWVRYFGATTPGVTHWGENIAVDRRGNIVVAGTCEIDGKRDWYAVSWAPSGKRRWSWRPGSLTSDDTDCHCVGAAVSRDGSVYLAGYQNDGERVTTVRLSSLGKRIWARNYTGTVGLWVTLQGITARPGGGVYVCGSVKTDDTHWAGLLVRYTATGRRKVYDHFVTAGSVHFTTVAAASDGSVVVAGTDSELGSPVMRYAVYVPEGLVAQSFAFGEVKRMWAGVATDSFGGFYVTASTHGIGNNGRIETHRGATIWGGGTWAGFYQPYPAMEWTEPNAIAVRGSTVVVVGYTDTGGPSGEDQVAIGYTY